MKNRQQGQVVVFLLLLTVILVTVLLSISARSLQQLRMSSSLEHKSRSFSAAEAAIEDALRQDLATLALQEGPQPISLGDPVIQEATYTVEQLPDYTTSLGRDEVAQVSLSGWTPGAVTVCWEREGAGNDPSLELTFYEQDPITGAVNVARDAVNAVPDRDNGFDNTGAVEPSPTGPCAGYENELTIDPTPALIDPANAIYLRIKTWYAPSDLKVIGVPPQVYNVEGKAETVSGETSQVKTQVYPASWPPIFDFVLFDGSGNPLKK